MCCYTFIVILPIIELLGNSLNYGVILFKPLNRFRTSMDINVMVILNRQNRMTLR